MQQVQPWEVEQIQTRLQQIEQVLSEFDREKFPSFYQYYREQIYKYEERLKNLLPKDELTDEEKANLHQRYTRQQKMYGRLAPVTTMSGIQKRSCEIVQLKEGILREGQFQTYITFYCQEAEELNQKEQMIKKNLKRLDRKKKQYQRYRDPRTKEEVQERIQEIEDILKRIPKEQDYQSYREFYSQELREQREELEYFLKHGKLRKFLRSKIPGEEEADYLEKLKELKRLKRGYKRYKVPKTLQETWERIDDLQDFLDDIPEEIEEFNEYRMFFQKELAKWKAAYEVFQRDQEETKRIEAGSQKKKKVRLSSSSSSIQHENKQSFISSPPTSEEEEQLQIKRQTKIKKYLVRSKESSSGIMEYSVDDKESKMQFSKKFINKEYNAYTLIDSEDENQNRKSKKFGDQSSESEEFSPRAMDNSWMKLGCKHQFKKQELIEWIEKRTDGLVITIQTDPIGQKFFKCKKCFYVITHSQIEKIFGKREFVRLNEQANLRALKLFDSNGNLSKEERKEKMSCMLCDSNVETKANHDDHYFCKKCWQGVNLFYSGNFGCCAGSFCTYFNSSVTNASVIRWIEEKRPNTKR